jgi:hypothetical protein
MTTITTTQAADAIQADTSHARERFMEAFGTSASISYDTDSKEMPDGDQECSIDTVGTTDTTEPALPLQSGNSKSDWEQIDREFQFLLERTFQDDDRPALSLVTTAPCFDDSPIIAAVGGFEECCGHPIQRVIGSNCRFMNRNCDNDPETLSFLRGIQASPESAERFMQEFPNGKQVCLLNRRPSHMASSKPSGGNASLLSDVESYTGPNIYFYNFLHVFGKKAIVKDEEKTLLIGIQCALQNGSDYGYALDHTSAIQQAVLDTRTGLGAMFNDWCCAAMDMFQECYMWQMNAGEESSLQSAVPQRPLRLAGSEGEDFDEDHATCVQIQERALSLISRLLDAEEDSAKMVGNSTQSKHLSTRQEELIAMRESVCSEFRQDIMMYISWYSVGISSLDPPNGMPALADDSAATA